MRLSSRVRYAVAGLAVTLTVGALAVPWYSSRLLSGGMQTWAAEHAKGELRVRNLAHEAGWLNSTGSLDVEWRSPCAENGAAGPVVHLTYRARHVPDLQGWTRLDWSASPEGATAERLLPGLAGGKLTGTGYVGFEGNFSADMQLPELALVAHGRRLQVAPSSGRLELGATSLRLDWLFERMALRGASTPLEAQQVSVVLDLKNRTQGTGKATVDIEKISTADVALEGLRVRSETVERAERLDSRLTQSLRRVQFMGQQLDDLVLEAEVKGLHLASIQALGALAGDSCGPQRASADKDVQLRAAVKQLLLAGFSVGIPKLQGRGQDGALDGHVVLTLAPATGDAVTLASQLSTQGQIHLKGNLMLPEQKAFALSTGYVNEVPGGLESGFEYGGGALKVGGKSLDGSMVLLGLQKLDGWINAFLAGERFELPEEEVPAVPPSEAPPGASAATAS